VLRTFSPVNGNRLAATPGPPACRPPHLERFLQINVTSSVFSGNLESYRRDEGAVGTVTALRAFCLML